LYHILSRGNERRDIFLGDDDYEVFLGVLEEMSDRIFQKDIQYRDVLLYFALKNLVLWARIFILCCKFRAQYS